MGYLYIKVIETKKVAIRSSFYVNYPFVRLRFNGKEQRNTNFRAGIEWWDKIFCYRVFKYTSDDHYIIAQARDKSIHIFGSDWIGEVRIPLKGMLDGSVHQKWFKLGKGRKSHPKQPRGYVHLAFQYAEDNADTNQRPFSSPSVEPVQTFEEYLANSAGETWGDNRTHSWSSSQGINPSPVVDTKSEKQKLSKSLGAPVGAPLTPLRTKAKSSRKLTSTSPAIQSRGKSADNLTFSNKIKRSTKSDLSSGSDSDDSGKRRGGDLIDFSDMATVKSQFDGMFPPYKSGSRQYEDAPAASDYAPSGYETSYKPHDVRDVSKSSDDQTSFSKPGFTSAVTGKNPFIFDADPFASSVGAH